MNKDNRPHQQQEMFETDRPETHDSGPVTCFGMTFENDDKRREYFLEKLREKLKDPEFRKIEGFPIGEDEDILSLSDPPYYTACPIPFIEDFIKHYGKPYDPTTDEYRKEPFAADVSEGKNDPIYNAHAYHTKVSPIALKKYIEHFTEPDQIVLDFFAGTGMTGVASQSAKKGKRRSVLLDLSPLTTHVAGAFTSPFSLASSVTKAKDILHQAVKDLVWMYETKHVGWPGSERDPRKRVNSNLTDTPSGTVNFVVWSDVFNCSECGAEITFWNQAIDFKNKGVTEDFACPACAAQVSKRQLSRATETNFDSSLGNPITCAKKAPVLINYTFGKSRFEKKPDRHDFELLNQVERMNLHDWHPTDEIPKGDKTTEPVRLGITHAHLFYTKRNLIALSRLRALVGNDRTLLFWFTATLPWCGKENRLHIGNYFGRKGGK